MLITAFTYVQELLHPYYKVSALFKSVDLSPFTYIIIGVVFWPLYV